MDNHGIARVARTLRTDEQRRQDVEKINKYRQLDESIRAQASSGAYDPALFQLTSRLLRLNPEYYTIWNVRRRCLISGLLSKPSAGSWPSKASPSSSLSDTTKPSCDESSSSSSAAIPPDPSFPTTGKSGTTAELTGSDHQQPPSESDVASDINMLQSELAFTMPMLLEHPKCYWIWKYRNWILEQAILRLPAQAARKIWEAELALDSMMLTKDTRNFHAWGYRRRLVARLESPALLGKSMVEDEFDYTTMKIEGNLSNFSAWHSRSRLLLRLLDERGLDDKARAAFLDEELEYIQEGLNVGPDDQSLWYYHRYLVLQIVGRATGQSSIAPALAVEERVAYLTKEIQFINELLEDYGDIKWICKALLEYTLALQELSQGSDSDGQQDDPRTWLAKLRKLDPMQAGRWDDVERKLASHSTQAEQ
ncbi:Uu.00g062830.m01.CDS01 [Anthostomella pinea]|uniref:Geranylgeranyl transferase type-2 subunit alpha n=1 Tax=Anthostomella pinea TaxID=933095 RepID=A0AAI8VTA0_9PEZI|nr:Uu.00g062830.m01.CDS01 [Anthostomella pinea]